MRVPERIEFYRHSLGDEEKARILAALDDPILTTGNAVTEAEEALGEYLGVKHVVCLDSCTAALHLALVASGIGLGDEVIVPAMTFVATANAVLMAGATPVFADVDRETMNLTVATASPHVTPRTRAIIPVHLYGLLCDMTELAMFARASNLLLIEDSAHCIEATRRGSKLPTDKTHVREWVRPGSHSAGACLSFYATKNITCGEGGAFVTNDGALAEKVRRLSLHGMTTTAAERYRKRYRHWDVPQWGWKYNLDNIRGSLLLPQIQRLNERWKRRAEICESYEHALGGLANGEWHAAVEGDRDHVAGEIGMQRVARPEWSARHLFTILVERGRRDEVIQKLQDRGIGVAVNYRAVHLLEFYAREFGGRRGMFPVAEEIGDRTISLPLYPALTSEQIDRVISTVRAAIATTRAHSRSEAAECATA